MERVLVLSALPAFAASGGLVALLVMKSGYLETKFGGVDVHVRDAHERPLPFFHIF